MSMSSNVPEGANPGENGIVPGTDKLECLEPEQEDYLPNRYMDCTAEPEIGTFSRFWNGHGMITPSMKNIMLLGLLPSPLI